MRGGDEGGDGFGVILKGEKAGRGEAVWDQLRSVREKGRAGEENEVGVDADQVRG